ncbi:hypothetical protein EJ06DRAFT_581027 [Trichodelitschia bisporula]|uniref:Mitochondrial F1F0-ATP synthase g subunit n=1 Tax=Trichodelitschia bisporula TaxID=703511 RepID=A0A6G1I132_9PEZI|nr:hypothetical protein EJ06DRAFT_581027 [Trichodelitschia bisporula]
MSLTVSRAMLRRQQLVLRRAPFRNASSDAASAAKERAAQLQSKASEGLSRVTSSAGEAISKYGAVAGDAIGAVGGRTALVPKTIHYSKVGLELGKLVFEGQKMSPPSMQTFQNYFQPLLNGIRQPGTLLSSASAISIQPSAILARVRGLSTQELATYGVIAAEVIGFFTVGEIIGRMKLVGYRSSAPAHGH